MDFGARTNSISELPLIFRRTDLINLYLELVRRQLFTRPLIVGYFSDSRRSFTHFFADQRPRPRDVDGPAAARYSSVIFNENPSFELFEPRTKVVESNTPEMVVSKRLRRLYNKRSRVLMSRALPSVLNERLVIGRRRVCLSVVCWTKKNILEFREKSS